MNLNVRSKVLIIATLVILLTISAVVATNAYLSIREIKTAYQSRSLAIGKSLSIQMERLLQLGLKLEDIVGFEEQCQEVVAAYPGLHYSFFASRSGEILFQSGTDQIELSGDLLQAVNRGTEGVIVQELKGSTWHNAVVPSYNPDEEHMGSVVIAFPARIISDRLNRLLWLGSAIGLTALLTGLMVLFWSLSRFVTRPLAKLIGTVDSLSVTPLDLARRAPVGSSDELGQLGHAFNNLIAKLQHATVSKSEMERTAQESQRLSEALFEQKEQVEVTLRSIGDAVISVDSKAKVQFLNPAAENLCGWKMQEAVGLPLQNVLHLFDAGSKEPLPNPFEPAFFKGEAVSNRVDAELLARDGVAIGVDYIASPMRDSNGDLNGGVLTLRDVSNERNMAQRLSWEASHDTLTGLLNRREFNGRLEHAIANLAQNPAQHVVAILDLDRFKTVNDAAGHAAGDELLKQLAKALSERLRPTDTLARLGADEFALFLEDCPLDQAEIIATDLLEIVEEFNFTYRGVLYSVGVSIGLAALDANLSTVEVMTMADSACFMAKEQGRNRLCVYHTGSVDISERRLQADWVTKINTALSDDRFTLYHQSYRSLQSSRDERQFIEVLARLVDEDNIILQPMTFIPPAERYNLMPAIDRWVIKRVFSRYHKLVQQRSGKPLVCSINLAAASINSRDFLEFVRSQAQAHAIPKQGICFEISESAVINNLANASDFMRGCRSSGILIAVDDFGKNLNGFSYVRALPIDILKIDAELIRNLDSDEINKTITESIARISQLKNIKTVAKNTENLQTFGLLRTIGIDFAQGFADHIPEPLII